MSSNDGEGGDERFARRSQRTDRPEVTDQGPMQPPNAEDRGALTYRCEDCGTPLLTDASQAFASIAPDIWCGTCQAWYSPRSVS